MTLCFYCGSQDVHGDHFRTWPLGAECPIFSFPRWLPSTSYAGIQVPLCGTLEFRMQMKGNEWLKTHICAHRVEDYEKYPVEKTTTTDAERWIYRDALDLTCTRRGEEPGVVEVHDTPEIQRTVRTLSSGEKIVKRGPAWSDAVDIYEERTREVAKGWFFKGGCVLGDTGVPRRRFVHFVEDIAAWKQEIRDRVESRDDLFERFDDLEVTMRRIPAYAYTRYVLSLAEGAEARVRPKFQRAVLQWFVERFYEEGEESESRVAFVKSILDEKQIDSMHTLRMLYEGGTFAYSANRPTFHTFMRDYTVAMSDVKTVICYYCGGQCGAHPLVSRVGHVHNVDEKGERITPWADLFNVTTCPARPPEENRRDMKVRCWTCGKQFAQENEPLLSTGDICTHTCTRLIPQFVSEFYEVFLAPYRREINAQATMWTTVPAERNPVSKLTRDSFIIQYGKFSTEMINFLNLLNAPESTAELHDAAERFPKWFLDYITTIALFLKAAEKHCDLYAERYTFHDAVRERAKSFRWFGDGRYLGWKESDAWVQGMNEAMRRMFASEEQQQMFPNHRDPYRFLRETLKK